jgi:ribosomal protein S18 acetylase RimI-like enzyme
MSGFCRCRSVAPRWAAPPGRCYESRVTSWLIRRVGSGDLEALLALWTHADAPQTVTDNVESLLRLGAFDPQAILVAEVRGEVAGSLIAAWNGWRGSFYRLAVAPRHRRRGLATAVVREGETRLLERGAVRVDAIVAADEVAAPRFWTAVGYDRQIDRTRFVRNF